MNNPEYFAAMYMYDSDSKYNGMVYDELCQWSCYELLVLATCTNTSNTNQLLYYTYIVFSRPTLYPTVYIL